MLASLDAARKRGREGKIGTDPNYALRDARLCGMKRVARPNSAQSVHTS